MIQKRSRIRFTRATEFTAVIIGVVLVLIGAAMPVAAAAAHRQVVQPHGPVPWDDPFVVAPFNHAGHGGMIVVDQVMNAHARITTALVGLRRQTEYRIVGSQKSCSKPISSESRTFAVTINTGEGLDSFEAVHGNYIGTDVTGTRSVRVVAVGGGRWACSNSIIYFNYQGQPKAVAAPAVVGDWNGRGLFTAFRDNVRRGFVLVQRSTSGDRARIFIALKGLTAHHDYRVIGSSASCQESAPGTTRSYVVALKDVQVTSFVSHTLPATDGLYSTSTVRVMDLTDVSRWACGRQRIFDYQMQPATVRATATYDQPRQ